MNRFETCLQFVLEREGGYVNRSDDRGGPTNKGITQRVYSEYLSSRGLPIQPVRYIEEGEVADIYRTGYWDATGCSDLAKPVDLTVFDGAVNHGPRQSARFLQRAVGVTADGKVGRRTLEAEGDCAPREVVESLLEQRRKFYHDLVENNPSQQVFLQGWLNRLRALSEAAEKEMNDGT